MALNSKELEKYAKQLDYHIGSLVDLTDAMREIKNALDNNLRAMERNYATSLQEMHNEFASLTHQLEKVGLPKIDNYAMQIEAIKRKLAEDWPVAVDPETLELSEEVRAEYILDFIVMEHLENTKFLQYECGTGHIINEASNRNVQLAMGYDTKQEREFYNSPNTVFTCDFEEVKRHAPFDIVLLYDVLDHANNPEEILRKVKGLLSPKGRVFVRCHPWCSKHGGHLYDQINKAYLHLILNEVELTRMGYECKKTNKIYHPIQTYHRWFDSTGYNIFQEQPIISDPDSIFLEDPEILL